jgi:hypothetical protein
LQWWGRTIHEHVCFLLDIPFKGSQGRSNRLSIVHGVSYFSCGVNNNACIVHAVSSTPQITLNLCNLHSMRFFIWWHSKAVCLWFSLLENFILNVVSMTLHATCMWCQWPRVHCALGVNDSACIVHAVSMTPHALCLRYQWQIRCQWHRIQIINLYLLHKFEFTCENALALYSGAQDGCFNEKKEGRKFCDAVPLRRDIVVEDVAKIHRFSYTGIMLRICI